MFSVDGGSNWRNKDPFSDYSDVLLTGPKCNITKRY